MLKNIKLFSTDSDRTTYESSASYETPYVSKVAADNSVHYNRPVQIIEFTVRIWTTGGGAYEDHIYQFEQGMTWNDWVVSEYTNKYKYDNNTNIWINNSTDNWSIDGVGNVALEFNGHDDGGFPIVNNLTLISARSSDTISNEQMYRTTFASDDF